MTPKRRQIWIGDQRWTIHRTSRIPTDRDGECDYGARTIRVRASVQGEELAEVLIHEMLHARWPDLSEEAVTEMAQELAGTLYGFGFTHGEENDG
ncbi:MAG: hypothetical protein ACR2IT_03060 [Pirellulales bacterium]